MKLSGRIKFLFEHKPWIVLGIILLLSLFLRVFNLKDNIIFAYDQARDAQRIMAMIFERDMKLVGPETDIPGVFNGVLFYVLLIPSYFFSSFSPNAASLFLILCNVSMIPILYYLTMILFENKYVGYIAALLWAVSFEQIVFAKFISNASLMVPAATLFFFGLAIFLFQKKDWGLILSAGSLAAAIHFNFYLFYLAVFYPLFYFIFRPKVSVKLLAICAGIIFIILSPFIVAEVRWHFAATKGLISYFMERGKSGGGFNLDRTFDEYVKRITDMNMLSFYSFQKDLANLGIVFLAVWAFHHIRKDKGIFLFTILFSTFPLFLFNSGVLTVQVINTSIFASVTIAVAAGLYFLSKKYSLLGYVLMVVVIASNIVMLNKNSFANNTVFASHPLALAYEKQLIDYTYRQSNKEPFSVCGIMSPLFSNTIWSFLYETYGKQTYGYKPTWAGQKQILNKSYLEDDITHVKNRFLIVEPVGIPDFGRRATIYLEDKRSKLLETKRFGEFIVQKRTLLKEGVRFFDSQRLQNHEIEDVERVFNADPRYSCFIGY